jgi:Fe-S-cluster containining protein
MIVCLLMAMLRDDCFFVDGDGERIVCLLMLMARDDCLFALPSTSKQSSLTININKQTIISHHYHQQTNNHLSPLTSLTNNPLTITINKQTLLMVMVKDDCLFVDGNGER